MSTAFKYTPYIPLWTHWFTQWTPYIQNKTPYNNKLSYSRNPKLTTTNLTSLCTPHEPPKFKIDHLGSNVLPKYQMNSINLNRRLSNARWQQTYWVNFHCLRSSEHAHNSENNGLTRLVYCPLSSQKVSHWTLLNKLLKSQMNPLIKNGPPSSNMNLTTNPRPLDP